MTPVAVVTDACFLIDLDRAHRGAVAAFDGLLAEGEAFVIPSVVVGEVLTGAEDPRRTLERLERAGTVSDFTKEDALEAGRLARAAMRGGRFPGWNDALVAGFAARRGLAVVTRNPRHFPGVPTRTY